MTKIQFILYKGLCELITYDLNVVLAFEKLGWKVKHNELSLLI